MAIQVILPKEEDASIGYEGEPDLIYVHGSQVEAKLDEDELDDQASYFIHLWQENEAFVYQNCLRLMNNQQDAEELLANFQLITSALRTADLRKNADF